MSSARFMIPFALALTLAATGSAAAAGWSDTFSSERVAAHVTGEMKTIAVVAAGERNRELEQAAAALSRALRDSGKTELVMDDRGLGNLSRLDDAAIVARCAKLPVAMVAVVRLFGGESGAPPTTVVTFYDKQSEVAAALSARRGVPLEPPPASGGAGEGLPGDAASAVASLTKNISASQHQARERFEKEVVWFEDMVAVDTGSGAVVNSWTNAYQGKYKKPLAGDEFYETVGRPDLAEQYRSSETVRNALIVPGSVLGGLGLLAVSMSPLALLIPDSALDDDTKMTLVFGTLIGGAGVAGVGVVVGMVGGAINPHPVEPTEARELADDFNKKLARDLGLTDLE
ncbi:MAG: hypothetical protein JXR83_08590 [Deltaproteobacteria bacterium]|nr:hypothetical protein [Deltaproteobacteria bacterium]